MAMWPDNIKEVMEMMVPGSRDQDRPSNTWREGLKRDILECMQADCHCVRGSSSIIKSGFIFLLLFFMEETC